MKETKFKQTTVGRIPDDWKVKTLGEIGFTYSGLTGKNKQDFIKGNSLYITFLNVLTNPILKPELFEPVHVSTSEKQNKAHKGDLFFNTSSETPEEVGICSFLDKEIDDLYLNSFCFGYRLEDYNVAPLFLSYFFRSKEGRQLMTIAAQGVTRYNLSKTTFNKMRLALPPIKEQERIAGALTAVDNLIASLDKQITKMRNIKLGTMQHLLSSLPSTTPHKPLGSISEMQRGTSITKKNVVEGAIPVISGGQTPAYYCNMSNREGKCITVAGSGEYSGFVAYWDKPIFVCDAFSIKGKKQCITKYLFYVLRNMQTKIYATKKAGGGVPHVFISSIDHFLIPIPPIEEQERIASILTAMDNQIEALEKKRNKYEMLKQGMMQQLLTGNIRLV